jgi:hypothetical protein
MMASYYSAEKSVDGPVLDTSCHDDPKEVAVSSSYYRSLLFAVHVEDGCYQKVCSSSSLLLHVASPPLSHLLLVLLVFELYPRTDDTVVLLLFLLPYMTPMHTWDIASAHHSIHQTWIFYVIAHRDGRHTCQ